MEKENAIASIVMGRESDLGIMQEAQAVLTRLGVPHESRGISAHRTPHRASKYAQQLEGRGIKLVIAAAGKAAHLAGVPAGMTTLPVIGVPVTTSDLGGLDSLLSMVQMPGGVPVAPDTLGKAGAKNAAVLAVEILSLTDPELRKQPGGFREEMAREAEQADIQIG